MLTRDAIYEAFLDDDVARGFLHSHSYTGNALACRAALAVLDRFEQDDVLQRNRERAGALTGALAALQHDARVEHFRQRGMIWAFDVREELAGRALRRTLPPCGREHELLIRPIGRTVYLMPPYVLDDEALTLWLAAARDREPGCRHRQSNAHADRTPEPPTS